MNKEETMEALREVLPPDMFTKTGHLKRNVPSEIRAMYVEYRTEGELTPLEEYINATTPQEYIDSTGEVRKASYSAIMRYGKNAGKGIGYGSRGRVGDPLEVLIRRAEESAPEYSDFSVPKYDKGVKSFLKYTCEQGHTSSTTIIDSFLRGVRCPRCAIRANVVYLWRIKGTSQYKVGVTSSSRGYDRIHKVAAQWGVEAEIVSYQDLGEDAYSIESIIKQSWEEHRYYGLSGDGHTEVFTLSEDEAQDIANFIRGF